MYLSPFYLSYLFCIFSGYSVPRFVVWDTTPDSWSWNVLPPEICGLSAVCTVTLYNYIGAAWRSGLHVWLVTWRSWVWAPTKAPVVFLSKKLSPYCLVLVGSRNRFEREFTIKLKWIEGWLKCQISPLVKYRQKNKKTYIYPYCRHALMNP